MVVREQGQVFFEHDILLVRFLRFAWAYSGEVSPFIFLATALFTLFAAVLSVVYQTVKVSFTNPAEALRYE